MLLNKVIYSFWIIKHEGYFLLDSGCQATVFPCIGFTWISHTVITVHRKIKILKNWSKALENKHKATFLTDCKTRMFHNFLMIIIASRQSIERQLRHLTVKRLLHWRNEKGFSSMWGKTGEENSFLSLCSWIVFFYSQLSPGKGIQIPESGNFIWGNVESWALKSGIQLKDSGISLTIGIRLIQVPLTKNPESSTQNPAIHSVESRNQDFLGFSYMGRPNWVVPDLPVVDLDQ